MFKTTALTTLAIASILPLTAVAESPNWTFVEASYLSSELDNDDPGFRNSDNFEPDGFEVAGSYGFGKWGFVDLTYSEESNDENVLFSGDRVDLDVDLERLTLGVGAAWAVLESTDLYGRLAYEDWTLDVEAKNNGDRVNFSPDENGYSVAAGVRSIVWRSLELRGEVSYVDVDEVMDGEAGVEVGAYYTFADHFTVGGSFSKLDDYETMKATLRYQF